MRVRPAPDATPWRPAIARKGQQQRNIENTTGISDAAALHCCPEVALLMGPKGCFTKFKVLSTKRLRHVLYYGSV